MTELAEVRTLRESAAADGDSRAYYRALHRERELREASALGEFVDAVGNLFRRIPGGKWQWRSRLGRWIDMPEPPQGDLVRADGGPAPEGMARAGTRLSPGGWMKIKRGHVGGLRIRDREGKVVERGGRDIEATVSKRQFEYTGNALFDRFDPHSSAESGRRVRITKLTGAPPPGTMGQYHIADADTGELLGMVAYGSLRPLTPKEADELKNAEPAGMARPGATAKAPSADELKALSFPELVARIQRSWTDPNYAAAPHLAVMAKMNEVNDAYGLDMPGESVMRFLSNASSWKGPEAKAIKAELRRRLKAAPKGSPRRVPMDAVETGSPSLDELLGTVPEVAAGEAAPIDISFQPGESLDDLRARVASASDKLEPGQELRLPGGVVIRRSLVGAPGGRHRGYAERERFIDVPGDKGQVSYGGGSEVARAALDASAFTNVPGSYGGVVQYPSSADVPQEPAAPAVPKGQLGMFRPGQQASLRDVAAGNAANYSITELERLGLDASSISGRTDDDALAAQARQLLDDMEMAAEDRLNADYRREVRGFDESSPMEHGAGGGDPDEGFLRPAPESYPDYLRRVASDFRDSGKGATAEDYEEAAARIEGRPSTGPEILRSKSDADFADYLRMVGADYQESGYEATSEDYREMADSIEGKGMERPGAQPSFRAQDFRAIAGVLAQIDNPDLANTFANALEMTNPNFDRVRFVQAARGAPGSGRDEPDFRPGQPTSRHFEFVAAVLRGLPPEQRDRTADQFADYFASRNGRFDRDRFLRTARGELRGRLATPESVGRMSTEALRSIIANPNADPALRAAAREELRGRGSRSAAA